MCTCLTKASASSSHHSARDRGRYVRQQQARQPLVSKFRVGEVQVIWDREHVEVLCAIMLDAKGRLTTM
eukprot:3140389-Amphidinium_carterae.2